MHLFFLIFLSSFTVFAREDYVINIQYRGGDNLIYDCNEKYFVCVSDTGRDQCETDRQEAKDNGKENYPCAVLKVYKKKEDCLQKQYEIANVNALKRYCKLDRLKH